MAQVARRQKRLAAGVIAATLTPISRGGEPEVQLLAGHCRALLESGCTSIVLLGTTGEANSFTVAERQSILEGVRGSIPAEKLIVGTGCCAAGDTIALTRHALSLGVRRVLVLPPFYYKRVSDDGLFDAFDSTIESIADDRLRIFLYLIPQFSGIELGLNLIQRLHARFPRHIAGLKDSSGDWAGTEVLCRELGDRMDVLVGNERLLLRALAAGASGCVTAGANVNAAGIVELYEHCDAPENASLDRRVNEVRAAFEKYPMIPALKAYLAAKTGNETWRNVRAPLRPLSMKDAQALLKTVE